MADEAVQLPFRALGSDSGYLNSSDFNRRWHFADQRWTSIVIDSVILDLMMS